jgi:aminoglycoside 3-N-acetyltransferase
MSQNNANGPAGPSTRATLARELRGLGVCAGDVLFVHTAFSRIGPVAGGAASVIEAMLDVLGPGGLLLMPSFNLVPREQRASTWNIATTPSTVGWLTEVFRLLPGTVRSDHYSHSVAAQGRDAAAFVAGHRDTSGFRSPWDLAPWGATFGDHSPFWKAYERGAKLLMLGADYHSSTFVHLVEVLDWNARLAADPAAPYRARNRVELGAWWDAQGRIARGTVGSAECRLFAVRDYVDALLREVRRQR